MKITPPEDLIDRLNRPATLSVILLSIAAIIGMTALYLSLQVFGIIDTLVYAVLFGVAATLIPGLVWLGGPSFPGSLRGIMGTLHWVLGQVAFGAGYLVQRDGRWELWPGDEESVWIDGEKRPIETGQENIDVLGWQPFGILLDKDEDTLSDARVSELATSDGGQTVSRAGHQQTTSPAATSDEGWTVDLKRLWTRGISEIGSIASLEKAEEIAMREEASGGRLNGWEPIIGSAFGLLLGIVTGYVFL